MRLIENENENLRSIECENGMMKRTITQQTITTADNTIHDSNNSNPTYVPTKT